MDETTIAFSIIMIVTIPASAWVGYRVGYFRGYVAAGKIIEQICLVPARILAKKRFYVMAKADLKQKRIKIPFQGYFGEK